MKPQQACGRNYLKMQNNNMSELEKITRKCEELVICNFPKCELRGDYWKCYMGNYTKCPIYLDYARKKLEPIRHHPSRR